MSGMMTLGIILSATDLASGVLRKTQSGLDALAGSLAKFGTASLALGAGLTAALKPSVLAYANLDEAATQLRVTVMGANGDVAQSYGALSAMASEMGNRLPGTTADFYAMTTMLLRQGQAAENILGGIGEAAAQAGVLLKLPQAGAAEFVSKLQDATATTAKDMVALVDTIQRTFNVGVDPGNMLQAFAALSPGMADLKMQGLAGAQALAPLIAMLDQTALSGGAAGLALTKVFQGTFDSKAVAAVNQLPELAKNKIKLGFIDTKGESLGLENLFTQLEKLRALSTQGRQTVLELLFGKDAETMRALKPMIEKGRAGYDEMLAKMRAQAAAQLRIKEALGDTKNLWGALLGSVESVMALLAKPAVEFLKPYITDLNTIVGKVGEWVSAHEAVVRTGGLIAAGLAGVATVVGGIAIALGAASKAGSILAGAFGKGKGKIPGVGGAVGAAAGVTPVWVVGGALTGGSGMPGGAAAGAAGAGAGAARMGLAKTAAAGTVAFGTGLAAAAVINEVMEGSVAWKRFEESSAKTMAKIGFSDAQIYVDTLEKQRRVRMAKSAVEERLAPVGQVRLAAPAPAPAARPAPPPKPAGLSIPVTKEWEKSGAAVKKVQTSLTQLTGVTQQSVKLADGLGQSWGKTTAEIAAKTGALPGQITAFKGAMQTAGAQLGEGVVLGIESKTGAVETAARNLGLAAKNAFAQANQIQSPSRVFMRLGGFLTQGLALGIRAGAGAVRREMATLATALGAGVAAPVVRPVVAAPVGPAGARGGAHPALVPPGDGALAQAVGALVAPLRRALGGFVMPPLPVARPDLRLAAPPLPVARPPVARAPAARAEGGTVIHFSPTINVQGGPAAGVKEAVTEALKLSLREFERVAAAAGHAGARRAYG